MIEVKDLAELNDVETLHLLEFIVTPDVIEEKLKEHLAEEPSQSEPCWTCSDIIRKLKVTI